MSDLGENFSSAARGQKLGQNEWHREVEDTLSVVHASSAHCIPDTGWPLGILGNGHCSWELPV